MKIILAMVMSLDGKTTRWFEPDIYKWTSEEDQDYFFSLIDKRNLIIMGSGTFEAIKKALKLSPDKLRVVLTSRPSRYRNLSVLGRLEFFSDSPEEIVKKLEARGYKNALLVGGETINTAFLKSKLVNELWLTIEPKIFGLGNSLFAPEKIDISFQIKSIRKLNDNGTILLKYYLDP